MHKDENDVVEVPSSDFLVNLASILLIGNGLVGVGVLAILGYGAELWIVYSGFVILGVLLLKNQSDTQKAIIGLISMIDSFYSGIFWAGYVIYPFSTIMTLINMLILGLSFAVVCHFTCTWPNYDYD